VFRVVVLVVAVVVALASSRAHADVFEHARDDVALSEEGARLFEEGRAAAKEGNYPAACALFMRSLRIERAIGTQLNLADCYERTDQLRRAHEQFVEVEKLARDAKQVDRADFAAQRIKALEGKLATLIVHVADPMATGLRILIDNRSVPVRSKIVELLDPGPIEVIATTVDGRHTETVVLHGGRQRVVTLPRIEKRAPAVVITDTKFARLELSTGSLAAGIHVGIRANDLLGNEGAGLPIVGMIGLFAVSRLATDETLEQEQAQLYNSAQVWAVWNSAFALAEVDWGVKEEAALALGAHAAGFAGGLALWRYLRPSGGDIALVNSFFAWGTGFAYLGYNFIGKRDDALPTILAGDAALLVGAALATKLEVSRTRLFLLDLGGTLGLAAGGFLLNTINDDDPTMTGFGFLGGAVLGITATALLTMGIDDDTPPPAVTLLPTHNGVALSGAF